MENILISKEDRLECFSFESQFLLISIEYLFIIDEILHFLVLMFLTSGIFLSDFMSKCEFIMCFIYTTCQSTVL